MTFAAALLVAGASAINYSRDDYSVGGVDIDNRFNESQTHCSSGVPLDHLYHVDQNYLGASTSDHLENFNDILPSNGTAQYCAGGKVSRVIPAMVVTQETETNVYHDAVEDQLYDLCGDDALTYSLEGTLGKTKCDYGCSVGTETQCVYDMGYAVGNYSAHGNTAKDKECEAG